MTGARLIVLWTFAVADGAIWRARPTIDVGYVMHARQVKLKPLLLSQALGLTVAQYVEMVMHAIADAAMCCARSTINDVYVMHPCQAKSSSSVFFLPKRWTIGCCTIIVMWMYAADGTISRARPTINTTYIFFHMT